MSFHQFPFLLRCGSGILPERFQLGEVGVCRRTMNEDRKSTRLNSSHLGISYAVFCLKKKKATRKTTHGSSEAAATCHPALLQDGQPRLCSRRRAQTSPAVAKVTPRPTHTSMQRSNST